MLIYLSQKDSNLLNKYKSILTRKLHSAQKCCDEDLILLLGDRRKWFRNFRAESYIAADTISEDSKNRKQVVALKPVYTMFLIFGQWL